MTHDDTTNTELEARNRELGAQVEQLTAALQRGNARLAEQRAALEKARIVLEEKAAELALAGRQKAEFLTRMAQELRPRLDAILALGQQLADNPEGNLTPGQVELARTIHGAGTSLLDRVADLPAPEPSEPVDSHELLATPRALAHR